ncbi:ComF family protein [Parabacteroides sp. OttesenSCG-928-G21]|nr:ComF family protein [Parabacteroides sp. OttesenSCG-928-G21]
MKTYWNDFLNLFFPNLCKLCKIPLIEGEKHICIACLIDLPRTGFSEEYGVLPALQLAVPRESIGRTVAFLVYEKGGKVQHLVHSFKYYGNTKLAFGLGRQAAVEWLNAETDFPEIDVIIPIPLYKWRQRKRGYNQSEWIAKGINSVLNKELNTTAVQRLHHMESQTHKIFFERWLNVKDKFAVTDEALLEKKHILLVDDVITSGATMNACLEVVKNIPGIKISIFSLSIVK